MLALRKLTFSLALAAAVAAMAAPDLPKRTVNGKEYYYYEVPPKETIYSIGRKFGYTRDEIIKYNPQVADGLRAGDTLYFPVEDEEEALEQIVAVGVLIDEPEPEPEPEPGDPIEEKAEITVEEVSATEDVNVAVMLPFMLSNANITRSAENYTHFYQGMLLAIDDQAANSSYKVNLTAYDTSASADSVAVLIQKPAIALMDYIIAPADSASIEVIAGAADPVNATVVNLFGVKYSGETRHESVLQGNVPRDEMYALAIEAFCKRFAGKHVIIAHPTDVKSDKTEFVKALTAALVLHGIPYEQIDFDGRLSPELLADLPELNYVVVPTGSSRETLLRVMPSLVAYSEAHTDSPMELFGYPEWITHRGDINDSMHKLNTTIYSRFSADLDSPAAKQVRANYKKWFGKDLPQAVPNTVLLGYDAMSWILSAAEKGVTEPYQGIQNAFKVSEGKPGSVNHALYLIRYNSNGSVDAQVL